VAGHYRRARQRRRRRPRYHLRPGAHGSRRHFPSKSTFWVCTDVGIGSSAGGVHLSGDWSTRAKHYEEHDERNHTNCNHRFGVCRPGAGEPGTQIERNGAMMRIVRGLAAAVALAGGLGLAGLGAGIAQADPLPPHTWCPGDSMVYSSFDPSTGPGVAYQWDTNVCHTWYWVKSGGNVPYKGQLPSTVWDGEDPPNRSCGACGTG